MTEAHIPDDILDLLTGYALEALDDNEMLQAQQLLAERPDLRAFVSELRSTVDMLPEALPEALVAADLRQRTLQYAMQDKRISIQVAPVAAMQVQQPSRWRMLLGAFAAAATLVAVLAWGNVINLQRDLSQAQAALQQEQATLQQERTALQQEQQKVATLQRDLTQAQTELEQARNNSAQIVAALAGENTTIALRGPGGTGTAVRTQHNAVMVAAQLPPLTAGRTYQLWLQHNDIVVSGGTFQVDFSGHGAIMLAEGTPQADVYMITEEPVGGSTDPTTPALISGQGASANIKIIISGLHAQR